MSKLLVDYMKNNKNINIINEYQHILLNHLNLKDNKLNSNNYAFINSSTTKDIQCKILNCSLYKRNSRDRDNERNKQTVDQNALYYIDLLDNIHTFFVHGYDTGFRVKRNCHNNDDTNEWKEENEDFNKLFFDSEMKLLQNKLKAKRNNLCSIRGDERIKHNKFLTNFKNSDEQIHLLQNNDEETKDTENAVKEIEYSFGVGYYYWDYYKNNHDIDIIRNYGTGYKYSDWYIPRKYSSMKEEILNELDIKQYNFTQNKAQKLLIDWKYLKNITSRNDKGLYYNIKQGIGLSYDNLMSVLFYTDYSKLSYNFSLTFRQLASSETNENLKKRNSVFWHWSKLLHETIHCWGNVLNAEKSTSEKCTSFNKDEPFILSLYHGVSFIYFSSFVTKFHSPTSLTRQLEVATIFASTDGIIIEVEQGKGYWTYNPFYFNCSLVSAYAVEDERLFIGGSGLYNSLNVGDGGGWIQFRSIRTIKTNKDYLWIVRALSLFDTIITGLKLDEKTRKEKFIQTIDYYYKIINKLLMEKIGSSKKNKPKYGEYIQKCFNKFINEREKNIAISLTYINLYYPAFKKIFEWSKKCEYLLSFDFIVNLFTKCQSIRYKINSIDSAAKHKISSIFMHEFIEMLEKISNNRSTKVKEIELKDWYFNNNDMSLQKCMVLLNKQNKKWTTQIEKSNYNTYTITLHRL
eukprot:164971_1